MGMHPDTPILTRSGTWVLVATISPRSGGQGSVWKVQRRSDGVYGAGAESSPSRPVLIDFGMAWARPDEAQEAEFRTDTGQELGNRFLRLPEFSPGKDMHDLRSDVAMAAGVLLYTSRTPLRLKK
jgi:hypothetical protein